MEHLQCLLYEHSICDDDIAGALWASGVFQRHLSADELVTIFSDYDAFPAEAIPEIIAKIMSSPEYPKEGTTASAPSVQHADPASEWTMVEKPCEKPCVEESQGTSLAEFLSAPDKVRAVVEKARLCTADIAGKHIVGFLGATGSGKTTQMRYLLGHSMQLTTHELKNGGRTHVVDSCTHHSALKIGHDKTSETQHPHVECAPDGFGFGPNTYFVDLAGDFDTNPKLEVLMRNALVKAYILRNAASVRLVFMLPIEFFSVKKGARIEDDIADVIDLFPEHKWGAMRGSMITLVSPVARTGGLAALETTPTLQHLNTVRNEVSQLVEGATRNTRARRFFSHLTADIERSVAAMKNGSMPDRPACFVANPVNPKDRPAVLRFIAACTPIVKPETESFNVVLPIQAETILVGTCAHLLGVVEHALESVLSGRISDPHLSLAAGADSTGALLDLLSVLIDDLKIDVRQFKDTRDSLARALGRVWDETWLALLRSFTQAELRPEETEACAARIKRLLEFLARAKSATRVAMPDASPRSTEDEIKKAMTELHSKVTGTALSDINPATLGRFIAQLTRVEAAMEGVMSSSKGESVPSKQLAHALWGHLKECSGELAVDEATCRPHLLAARLDRLRSFDAECGAWLAERTGHSSDSLLTASIERVLGGLSELQGKCSEQLLRVVSGASPTQKRSQDVGEVKSLSVLYELTTSKELQDALQIHDLRATYYDGVVKLDALTTDLNYLDVSDVELLPRRVALYEALASGGDTKLRVEMRQKQEALFADIGAKARSIQKDFIAEVDGMYRQFKVKARSALGSSGDDFKTVSSGMMNREDSLALEEPPHSKLSKLLIDAAVLSTADATLRIPVSSNALSKMLDKLHATIADVLVIIERKCTEPLPMSGALPVAIDFVNLLLDVIPGQVTEASVGERGAQLLSDARANVDEVGQRLAACVTTFVNNIPQKLMDKARPRPGWVSMYVQGMDAAVALIRCEVAAAKPLKSSLTANVNECVKDVSARVKAAQDDNDFRSFASIFAEELLPMLHGGAELKKTAQRLMKSFENCVTALCDDAETTEASIDPNRFLALLDQLTAMQEIFSAADSENLNIYETITKARKGLRLQGKAAQTDFIALVKPDSGGINSANIIDAIQKLSVMDEGPQKTCRQFLNNVLSAALSKASSLRDKRSVEIREGVNFRLIFENADAKKCLDPDTINKWIEYERTITNQIQTSRSAFMSALDSGDEDEIERSKQRCEALQKLGEKNEVAEILSERVKKLQLSFDTDSKVNRDEALKNLIEGYFALPMDPEQSRASTTKVKGTFQKYMFDKLSGIKAATQRGQYRLALDDLEAAQAVIRTVDLSPSMQPLLEYCRQFTREVEKLEIDANERIAVNQVIASEDPVAGILQLLPQVSATGRASLLTVLETVVKNATKCDPATLDDSHVAMAAAEVQRLVGQLTPFDDSVEAPDTQARVRGLKEMLSAFERQHVKVCEIARVNITQVAVNALKAGRISVALVNALGAARVVEGHLSPDAKKKYAAAKQEFWMCLSKAIVSNLAAIKKGDFASVSFAYLSDIIAGFRSLSNVNALLLSKPPDVNVRFTNAANVQSDIVAAATEFCSKPLSSMVDSPLDLVQYYAKVRSLIDELSKFVSIPLPEPDVSTAKIADVLRVLCTQCNDAWDSVERSNHSAGSLKEFQKPASKLLAFSDSLEQVGVGGIVGTTCAECVKNAFLRLDNALFNAEQTCTTPGTRSESIAEALLAPREWARQAPCIEPRVSVMIKAVLTKLAAASSRLVRDVGTLLEQKGGAGKQIMHEYGDLFCNHSTDWIIHATKLPLDECVNRIDCDPPIGHAEYNSLKALLRAHEGAMKEYVKEMRHSVLTSGVTKSRDMIRRAVKDAACKASSAGTPELFGDLVSRVCQMYALFSIQAAASDAPMGLPDPVLPHLIQIATIYRLLSMESSPQTFFERMKNSAKKLFNIGSVGHRIPNHLVQILTGEGKSITLAILAAVFVQYGIDVDIVCYSKYLTSRDKAKMEPFFVDMMGFKEGQVRYLTFAQLCALRMEGAGAVAKKALASSDVIQGGRDKVSGALRMLLIDEVDVFFSKRFYGATYNAGVSLQGDEEFNLVDVVHKHAGRPFAVLECPELAAVKKKYDAIHQPLDVSSMHRLFDMIALKLVESSTCFSREGQHQLNKETREIEYKMGDQYEPVVYPNESSLLYVDLMRNGTITEATAKRFVGLDVDFGHFSYAEIPSASQQCYAGILGVTGTLKTVRTSTDAGTMILTAEERCILRDDYAVERFTFAPSVFGDSKLNGGTGFEYARDTTIRFNDEDWCVAIVDAVKAALAGGKGACIIFVKNAKKYLPILKQRPEFADVAVLSEATPEIRRPGIISGAVLAGTVTIATRSYVRGTDFYVPDDTHFTVIQTWYSSLESEHVQCRGRTARLAKAGTYKMILCSVHMEGKFFMAEVKQAAQPPAGAPDNYDPTSAISSAVENVLRAAIANNTLAQELTRRRAQKTAAKTAGRLQQKNIAKKLDVASWKVIDALLSQSDRKSKIDALVAAAASQIGSPVVFTVIIDVSSSMRGSPWSQLIVAYDAFLREMRSLPDPIQQSTTLSVILFGATATEYYTGSIASATALPASCPGGSTNFEAGLAMAQSVFQRPAYRGFNFKMVFFTDGYPNSNSNHLGKVNAIAEEFPNQLTEFFCIYFAKRGDIPHAVKELHNAFESVKVSSQLIHACNVTELKAAMTSAAHSGPMYRQ